MDKEIICQARQADLVAYLNSKAERLVKDYGETYHLAEHDSLKITGNRFYWFSQGYGGNALDFAMKYYGLPFKEAVEELTGEISATAPPTQITYEAKTFELPERAENEKRVLAYLIQKRGLTYETVQRFIKDKLLYQDVRGNCVFVIKDFSGESVIAAEIVGTTDERFKKTTPHKGFGFHVLCGKCGDTMSQKPTPKRRTDAPQQRVGIDSVLFFESAIDLLSYYQFYKPYQNELLVSMGGVNPSVCEHIAQLYHDCELVVCTDNDAAGENFAAKIAERFPDRYRRKSPPEEKDWNDFIRKRAGED